jgi:hypothetical protein
MSSDLGISSRVSTAGATTRNKVGLVLAALLGLSDLVGAFLPTPGSSDPNSAGPPLPVLLADGVIGLVTLIAVIYTWRTGSRISARIVAGTRVLSALSALPAFFVKGVPAGTVALVGALVVLTVVSIVLVLARPTPQPTP